MKNSTIKNDIIDNILQHEVVFFDSKSSGPGGQHVNTTNSKIALNFNIQASKYLTDEQKKRLIQKAGNNVHHDQSILMLTCKEERNQLTNKKKVIANFAKLLAEILKEPKKRKPVVALSSNPETRKIDKKKSSQIKQLRQKPSIDEH